MSPFYIMTDDEINELIEFWGNRLPNPEHYPKTFMWYVKLWRYYRDRHG